MSIFPFPSVENLILWACSAIVLLTIVISRQSIRHHRHRRKQQSARRVIKQIKKMPTFPKKICYLRKIDPFVFEELLLHAFEDVGFEIIRNPKYTGDGGIDGRFSVDGRRFLIQAKRYSSWVSTAHIEQLHKQAIQENCLAVFCHTGKTRKKTLDIYRSNNRLMVISGEALISLVEGDTRLADRLRTFAGS
ncbi:restriction endonuclease [Escherichia coli]|nr:restriction endonuclease [Salmonella enterica]EJI5534765.1 restriction endonuclease [Escherichia coli]EJK1973682.1 restriction endonuclease [Salmonella enterica]